METMQHDSEFPEKREWAAQILSQMVRLHEVEVFLALGEFTDHSDLSEN
jgi:hypothetical protein